MTMIFLAMVYWFDADDMTLFSFKSLQLTTQMFSLHSPSWG